jgi:hypothetical protein
LNFGRSKATEGHDVSMNGMAFGLSEEPTVTTKRESQMFTIGGSSEGRPLRVGHDWGIQIPLSDTSETSVCPGFSVP